MLNTSFTPVDALLGGALIGLSAVMLMLFLGRIMGISGIVGGVFEARTLPDLFWRLAFVAGIIAAPLIYEIMTSRVPQISPPSNTMMIVVAGLLVGFGSTMGSGCTSGHGICGLSRMSRRSIAAVGVFMTVAVVTVFLARHVI